MSLGSGCRRAAEPAEPAEPALLSAPAEAPASVPAEAPASVPAEVPAATPAEVPAATAAEVPAAIDPATERLLAERRPALEHACAGAELQCEEQGDLDGDGRADRVVLVRPRGGAELGLAILWGHGGADVLGARVKGQRWRERDDGKQVEREIPADLEFLARWDVWLADGARKHVRDARGRKFAVPGLRGDALLLDGGDSATVAYHDGRGWRLQYLGF